MTTDRTHRVKLGKRSRALTESGAKSIPPSPESDAVFVTVPRVLMPVHEVKDLQRRAYERGRAHATEEQGVALAAAIEALSRAAAATREACEQLLNEGSAFAVRLACVMTEELVGRALDAEHHDVRSLLDRSLAELFPDGLPETRITLRGHPDDLARLAAPLREKGGTIELRPDSEAARGAFRVECQDLLFETSVLDRLEQMRERLLAEVDHG